VGTVAQGLAIPVETFVTAIRRRVGQYVAAKAHGTIKIVIQNGVIVRIVEEQSHTLGEFVQGGAPAPRG